MLEMVAICVGYFGSRGATPPLPHDPRGRTANSSDARRYEHDGPPSAIPAVDGGCRRSMSLPSRRSLAEGRIALGSFDRFLLLYCALFAAFGVASPFLPALLHERGLGPSEISAVLAAGTAIRLIIGPAISRLADRLGKHQQILARSVPLAAVIAVGRCLPPA